MIVAGALGGAIGAQRQATHKPAGLRTHMLVALGCCAFMELSRLTGDTRLAANILTGIGFLGAGAIFRDGTSPRGLTTAASIWSAAAVGTSVGFATPSAYVLAAATAGCTLVALSFSDSAIDRLLPEKREADLQIVFDLARLSLDDAAAAVERFDLSVHKTDQLRVVRSGDATLATWSLRVNDRHPRRLREAVVELARLEGVASIAIDPRRA